jgi:hypothetical protein
MKTENMLETPVYPQIPECKNVAVGSISSDNLNAAWLAGILDGEGCIHTTYAQSTTRESGTKIYAHYRCRVEIRNTDPFMIHKITTILSSWKIRFFVHFVKSKAHYKEGLAVIVSNYKGIQSLLQKTLPHLTAKHDEAKIMLDFVDWRVNVHPMKGCNGGERLMVLRDHYVELHDGLRALKRRLWSTHRLPIGNSCPIDLSKLEVRELVV